MGELKVYDVSGKEIEGRIMPAGAHLRLRSDEAERLGLKTSRPPADATAAKPAAAANKARPAPAKRAGKRA